MPEGWCSGSFTEGSFKQKKQRSAWLMGICTLAERFIFGGMDLGKTLYRPRHGLRAIGHEIPASQGPRM